MSQSQKSPLRVAIAGLGAVGLKLAHELDKGIEGLSLAAVSARDKEAAAQRLSGLTTKVPVLDIADLEPLADIVIECAPASLLSAIATPFLKKGKSVIVLSAGALLANMDLVDLAKAHGGQIVVPTGALIGLDAVTAAAWAAIPGSQTVTGTTAAAWTVRPRRILGTPAILFGVRYKTSGATAGDVRITTSVGTYTLALPGTSTAWADVLTGAGFLADAATDTITWQAQVGAGTLSIASYWVVDAPA